MRSGYVKASKIRQHPLPIRIAPFHLRIAHPCFHNIAVADFCSARCLQTSLVNMTVFNFRVLGVEPVPRAEI